MKQLIWTLSKNPSYYAVLTSLSVEHMGLGIPSQEIPSTSLQGYMYQLCRGIGSSVARLHMERTLHGDLTTSNIMVQLEDAGSEESGVGAGTPGPGSSAPISVNDWNARWLTSIMHALTAGLDSCNTNRNNIDSTINGGPVCHGASVRKHPSGY